MNEAPVRVVCFHFGDMKWRTTTLYPLPSVGDVVHFNINDLCDEQVFFIVEFIDWRYVFGSFTPPGANLMVVPRINVFLRSLTKKEKDAYERRRFISKE